MILPKTTHQKWPFYLGLRGYSRRNPVDLRLSPFFTERKRVLARGFKVSEATYKNSLAFNFRSIWLGRIATEKRL